MIWGAILNFFVNLGRAVGTQIVGVLGIFFVIGFLLSLTHRATHRLYYRAVGWRGILWTAWLGTPIHEFGHIVFAKLFRHRLVSVSLFRPNERTGNLGHVDHSYSNKSIYQRLGNFFIGAAPLIFGAAVLSGMLYFFVPGGAEALRGLTKLSQNISQSPKLLGQSIELIFTPSNLKAWNFWLWLYMSFAIASHLAPSKEDLSGMWRGWFWFVLLLIAANAVALLIGRDITPAVLGLNRCLKQLLGIFLYALLLSTVHMLAALVILGPFKRRR